MSELLSHLGQGMGVVLFQSVYWLFGVVPLPMNVLFCLLGALVGTLVGVLPGIGTVATIAMLLPITFGLPPVGALIMLAGIYYGKAAQGRRCPLLRLARSLPAVWRPFLSPHSALL
jgi:putative tricarboxylic transport membrane protein